MTEPTPAAGAPGGNRSVMIILAYLWLLALVPLLVEKNDSEVQWHAKHGIVLMVAEVIFWIIYIILTTLLGAITGGVLGCIISLFSPLLALVIVVIHVIAMVKGVNGQRFMIPMISEYANKF
jgi:uncharacterized membrane protein